jgi:hypothetical protein
VFFQRISAVFIAFSAEFGRFFAFFWFFFSPVAGARNFHLTSNDVVPTFKIKNKKSVSKK